MMRIAALILGAALLSGCQTMAGQDNSENDPGYTFGGERGPGADQGSGEDAGQNSGDGAEYAPPGGCPASAYQVLIGQHIGEIHTDSLPSPRRIYGRGDMVTLDYRPDRLNIVTGDDGRVVEVKCG